MDPFILLMAFPSALPNATPAPRSHLPYPFNMPPFDFEVLLNYGPH